MATAKRTRKPKAEKATNPVAEVTRTNAVATASVSSPATKVTARAVDINQAIRLRAYELYVRRGFTHGQDFDDWLRAESEVRATFGAA